MQYKDLDIWIKSRELVSDIYRLAKQFPQDELYGLTNQIRRCAISVPSNIAEGCGRQSPKDTIRFLFIARGSMYELETQLYLAKDLGFLDNKSLEDIFNKVENCKKLINGFIRYYKTKL